MRQLARVRALPVLWILGALGVLAVPQTAHAQAHYPVLQVEPTMNTVPVPNAIPFRDACLNPSAWPTGWDRTDFFGNAHQMMATLSDGDLAQCFANVRAAGKQLVVAAGALKPQCNTAQECWTAAATNLIHFRDLGAVIDYLEIDEPLTTGQQPMDYTYAVQQTAEFIRLARLESPDVKVILQESYPTQTASTLISFYRDVNNETIARTGWGIQYGQVDHDWNRGGTPGELAAIQNSLHSDGISFGVIFWAARSWSWYDGLMHQAQMYNNWRRFGVTPDMYAVIDWRGDLTDTVPEWAGRYVFTNSVRDFANTYLPTQTSIYGLRADDRLYPNESRTSVDGRFTLVYQGDGNLVLYYGGWALWASNTWGTPPGYAVMQGDGNFVVYDANGVPRWSSNTWGHPGAYLVVQSDGNLVIYRDYWAMWATNTNWF